MNPSRQLPVLFYFSLSDLIATSVGGRAKGGNQIKIPLYYPAVGMPLAGIRARLRSSARCVLRGLPPVHKRNYSDRRAGDTKRPDVPVEGTEEGGTAPSGPASSMKVEQEDGSFGEVRATHTDACTQELSEKFAEPMTVIVQKTQQDVVIGYPS